MKIYRVKHDLSYWKLFPVDRDFWNDRTQFSGQKMAGSWVPPLFYPRDPVRSRKGDFYNLTTGALAFSKRVLASQLGKILMSSGEVLPAQFDDPAEEIFVFNPLEFYDCLDQGNTDGRWSPDHKTAIEISRFAFYPERIGTANLFKIPETHKMYMYALAGRDSPEVEFYHQYHSLGYEGLKFDLVWSDEPPPLPL